MTGTSIEPPASEEEETVPVAIPVTEATPAEPSLHVLLYVPWQREAHETFEVLRARLLDALSALSMRLRATGSDNHSQSMPLRHVMLGGQTIILDDVATVLPDLVTRLVIANAGGRLGVGPWYVIPDFMLVDGEAIVRNLLAGRADAVKHGVELLPVAFIPGAGGYCAQLPQILNAFDIDAALVQHAAPLAHMSFRWEAPDGSSVLAVNHDYPVSKPEAVKAAIEEQQQLAPDGPFLWLVPWQSDADISALLQEIGKSAEKPLRQSTPVDLITDLRQRLPDILQPALVGELRLQTLRPHSYIFSGRLSSRVYLKQLHADVQTRLLRAAEPWTAIALTHGKVTYPQNLQALLDYSWRLLMQNQARDALGGSSVDTVHVENEARYRKVGDVAEHITQSALQALSGKPVPAGTMARKEAYITVWNSHGHTVSQVVELPLRIPEGRYPVAVLSPDGQEVNFGWQPMPKSEEYSGKLSFLATVPAVGYAAYTVKLGDKLAEQHHVVRMAGMAISNLRGETLAIDGEILTWKRENNTIVDLLRYIDGGDAGDVFNYSPPKKDLIVQASLANKVDVETGPTFSRLHMLHRMRIAPSLDQQRHRKRGLRLLEIHTTATFYEHVPGLYFRASYTNTAEDHRLRVHLRSGVLADTMAADSAFGLQKRLAHLDGPRLPMKRYVEGISNEQPLHSLMAVGTASDGMVLLTRGLHAAEAIREQGQTTLALTLLRAIGWLSRSDLRTRLGAVAPEVPVPDAQCLRALKAEFALAEYPESDSALMRMGQSYTAPLQAYQYAEMPEPASRSYLTVEGDAVLTSLKPPQTGEGWVARLLNPSEQEVTVYLSPANQPQRALLLNLAEKPQAEFEMGEGGRIKVTLKPYQIATVRLNFT